MSSYNPNDYPITHAGGVVIGPPIIDSAESSEQPPEDPSIILVLQRKNRKFSLPKGGIESSDNPADPDFKEIYDDTKNMQVLEAAANREVYEETGLKLSPVEYLGWFLRMSANRDLGFYRQAMFAYCHSGKLKMSTEPKEILQVGRYAITSAIALLDNHADKSFLRNNKDRITDIGKKALQHEIDRS